MSGEGEWPACIDPHAVEHACRVVQTEAENRQLGLVRGHLPPVKPHRTDTARGGQRAH